MNIKELWNAFYAPHRAAGTSLYNNDCIYTPDVIVCKSDISYPERLDEKDWYTVDVITCATPNLRERPSNAMNPNAGNNPAKITEAELRTLLEKRVKRIFEVATQQKADVLILGAFGCGAFRNPPEIVAEVFADIQKNYEGVFETIEYAIYCRDYEMENYEAFCRVME